MFFPSLNIFSVNYPIFPQSLYYPLSVCVNIKHTKSFILYLVPSFRDHFPVYSSLTISFSLLFLVGFVCCCHSLSFKFCSYDNIHTYRCVHTHTHTRMHVHKHNDTWFINGAPHTHIYHLVYLQCSTHISESM